MNAEATARQYYQLLNEHRFDDAAALIDNHASFHYLSTRQRFVGRAGFYELMKLWLGAFTDLRVTVLSVQALNDHAVQVEFLGRGTHTGDLTLGDAVTVPATGRSAELVFRNLLEIHNGTIISVELDFDVEEMKRRLAGHEAPARSADV
jgi:hypothetical protein